MNKLTIQNLLKQEITRKNAKKLIEIILENSNSDTLRKVRTYVLSAPYLSNGSMSIFKWKDNYRFSIYINIYPYITDKSMTDREKWFYIYVTILHEIEHINLLMNENKEWDYSTYIAVIEEMEKQWRGVFYDAFSRLLSKNKNKGKIYDTSSVELSCRYKSLNNAYGVFETFLSDLEKEKIQIILESSKLLVDFIEIGYLCSGAPYNKFTKSVVKIRKNIKKKLDVLHKYPQLCSMYTSDGNLKSFEKIYRERNEKNKDFIDNILLKIFMYLEQDYNMFFENNVDLKKHMEFLANKYCNACMYYMENVSIGTIFLDKEVIDDNTLLLLKNVKYINRLMDSYGMLHTFGSLFFIE